MRRMLMALLCLLVLVAPAARASHRQVTPDEIIQLTQSGLSDETIITFLETRDLAFVPDVNEIVRLRAAGVSEVVIQYLVTRTAVRPPSYAAVPPPPPAYPVGYYAPGYATAAIVSVGFPLLPYWLHDFHVPNYLAHGSFGHVDGFFSSTLSSVPHGLLHGSVVPHGGLIAGGAGHAGQLVTVGHGTSIAPIAAGHVVSSHGAAVHAGTGHAGSHGGGGGHGGHAGGHGGHR